MEVRVTIDENGSVIAAEAISGHALLRDASEVAARNTKFPPTTFSGKAVKVTGILIYNFNGGQTKLVDEVILNGKALSLVKPEYPLEARKANAQGAVRVKVMIDEQGNIVSAEAISGDELLRRAAEEAALKSKFSPTIIKDKAVKVTGVIVYNFIGADKLEVAITPENANNQNLNQSNKVIDGGILNNKAVSLPFPEIPPAAKAVGAAGKVNVEVAVNEEGDVVSAKAISGHVLLRQAAEKAAMNAKFSQTMIDGKTVMTTGLIVYNFSERPKK